MVFLHLGEEFDTTERSFYSAAAMVSRGEQTRDTILQIAAHEAARVGLGGLTIGALAKRLDMSKSGLFAHFNSKETLLIAVLEHQAEVFTNEVVRPALKAPRGEARVRALFDGWLRWLIERAEKGCLFIAAAAELDDQPGKARVRLVAQQRDLLELFASVVVTAIKQGDFRSDLDPEQATAEAHGILLGYHYASRLLEDPRAEERARLAFDRLVADARC